MSGPDPKDDIPPAGAGDRYLGGRATAVLGAYFIGVAVGLGYLLYSLWQSGVVSAGADRVDEVKLVLVVMIAGALGSYVHAASSFADFVGNRRLAASWLWWYFLRPFIGVALALVLYFAIRGGLLPMGADVHAVSLFGIAAISALAGMFSKQATDKLKEVFDTFFKTATGDQRADKLHNPVPKITAIDPATVPVATEHSITVSGSDFVAGAIARLAGSDLRTDVKNGTQLVASLTAADTRTPGSHNLTVFNPPPGGGSSTAVPLVVQAAG